MIPIKYLLDEAKKYNSVYAHNNELFNIYEGDLLTYLLRDMQKSLSPEAFQGIQTRISPINILKRMVDKLSKIYANPPIRELNIDTEKNKSLFMMYEDELNPNVVFNEANTFFNLFKNTLVEPYLEDGEPKARVIPSDRFFVYSNDPVCPNEPTHVLKFMGKVVTTAGEEKQIVYAYSATEFLITDLEGNIQTQMMTDYGNPDGVNPYGKLPFIYINRSSHKLIPTIDTDTLAMTKLIPTLLSDLNYAVLFQSFSIIYGIDITFENLSMNPNALWSFKSDPTTDKNPQIGSIKPQVDIDQVLRFIGSQLTLWFQTKNIKAGAIDKLTVDSASSGIAKAIDEMDTAEDRQIQTQIFQKAEEDFWELIINYMHPIWVKEPEFMTKQLFELGTEVSVQFPKQKAIYDETTVMTNSITKWEKGFIPKKKALSEMYPDATSEELDEWLAGSTEENTVTIEEKEPNVQ